MTKPKEERTHLWSVWTHDYDDVPIAICSTKKLAEDLSKALGYDSDYVDTIQYFSAMPEIVDVLHLQLGIDPLDDTWDSSSEWHERFIADSRLSSEYESGSACGSRYPTLLSFNDKRGIVSVWAKGTNHRKVRREFKKLVAQVRIDAPLRVARYEAETYKREAEYLRAQVRSYYDGQRVGS